MNTIYFYYIYKNTILLQDLFHVKTCVKFCFILKQIVDSRLTDFGPC